MAADIERSLMVADEGNDSNERTRTCFRGVGFYPPLQV